MTNGADPSRGTVAGTADPTRGTVPGGLVDPGRGTVPGLADPDRPTGRAGPTVPGPADPGRGTVPGPAEPGRVGPIELGQLLPPADLAELGRLGRRRRVRPGLPIFVEGTLSDSVVIVTAGRVKIFTTARDGTESVLALRGPGALLGDLSFIDGGPRSASVVALEPGEVLVVGARDFTDFLSANPSLLWALVRMLTARLRDADVKRAEFTRYDTLGRVALRLVELAERHGRPDPDGVRITMPLTQEELAGWVGSSLESTAKALRTLRERGVLTTRRRTITVHDLDELRRRAGG